MTKKPRFLMVPALKEDTTATVSWQDTQADQYELDTVWGETFDTASRGKSWSDCDMAAWAWTVQDEAAAVSWQELAELPAQGLMWQNIELPEQSWADWEECDNTDWRWIQSRPASFAYYRGPGEEIAAPDQGRAWWSIDDSIWSWQDQDDDEAHSWTDFQRMPSVGLEWWQHGRYDYDWTQIELECPGWYSLAQLPAKALAWRSLDAHWMPWKEFAELGADSDGLSWTELETLPADNQPHRGTDVDMPLYKKTTMLRVRALDEDCVPSDYLTTNLLPVEPLFHRDDKTTVAVKKGQPTYLQVCCRSAYDMERAVMTLRYDPTALKLVDLAAQRNGRQMGLGWLADINLDIPNFEEGKLRLRYHNKAVTDYAYTGLITLLEFTGLRDTQTEITLS